MAKLKSNEIYTVAKTLIGSVEPYGDEAIDRERLANMETLIEVTDMLLDDIMKQCDYCQRPEASIRAIAYKAKDYLREIGAESEE